MTKKSTFLGFKSYPQALIHISILNMNHRAILNSIVMRNDKFRAYKLRFAGRSYSEISNLLDIPKSTLSGWFSDLEIPQEAQDRIKKRVHDSSLKALLKRNANQTRLAETKAQSTRAGAIKEVGPLSKRDLFIAGIALYWAEGHKRPIFRDGKAKTYHPVSFTNSDPNLVNLFIKFLREICKVDDRSISIGLRIFDHQDPAYLMDFWQKIVRIPTSRFYKVLQGPSISSQRKRPFNALPYGTVQVRVNSTSLYHKIMGWIDGLGKII